MVHAEGHFLGSDGRRLYYQCWLPEGKANKAAIIILHGWFAHSGWYLNLPQYETSRGYAVYAYDQRGWGRSDGQRGYLNSWQENLDDLDIFLKQVRDEEPGRQIYLMGHTGSSPIVLEYALIHPGVIRAVFCVSPVLDISPVLSHAARKAVSLLSVIAPHFTMDVRKRFNATAHTVSHDPDFIRLIQTDPLGNTKLTMRMLSEGDTAMKRVNSEAEMVDLPVLFLVGGDDRTIPPEITRAYFERLKSADKQMLEYPGAYTNLLSDTCYEDVLRDIDHWLDLHLYTVKIP